MKKRETRKTEKEEALILCSKLSVITKTWFKWMEWILILVAFYIVAEKTENEYIALFFKLNAIIFAGYFTVLSLILTITYWNDIIRKWKANFEIFKFIALVLFVSVVLMIFFLIIGQDVLDAFNKAEGR